MKRLRAQVQDYMTATPIVVEPSLSLVEAYDLMFEHEIRRLPVVEDGVITGIVTLSDLLQAMPGRVDELDMETKLELTARTVGDIMTYDPVTIGPDESIREAAERLLEYQISGLPVVQDEHVVGIITESDIFRLIVNDWSTEPD